MRTDHAAVCEGKQQYDARGKARAAANAGRAQHGGKWHVYPCPFSPPGGTHYHVGHMSPAQAKRYGRRNRYSQYA